MSRYISEKHYAGPYDRAAQLRYNKELFIYNLRKEQRDLEDENFQLEEERAQLKQFLKENPPVNVEKEVEKILQLKMQRRNLRASVRRLKKSTK